MSRIQVFALPIVLIAGLSACNTDTARPEAVPAPPPPVAIETNCGADQLGAYVGVKATDDVIAKLQAWRGDHIIRILKPNSPMTMDYRPDRLNIYLDKNGVIEKMNCV